jgi:hypothetical protein
VDATHSGSTHAAVQAAAEATAAAALAAEAVLARNGDNITSGTVADARIASTIARDSEVTTAVGNEATARDAAIAAAVAGLLNSAPGALDTLDELAAALGDDANFATTVTNALALKAAIADVVLKTLYDANSVVIADTDNTPIALASGGIVAATPSQLRTLLTLVVGTDVQAFSAVLAATTASFTTALETKLNGIATGATAYTDAAAKAAAVSDTAYDATSWDGVTDVAPSKNAVRDKFQTLVIGTDVQAFDADLTLRELGATIDGGGSAITTGAKKVYLRVPWNCTITGWTILLDQSGSIVIDVWKDTYANFPPTVADTITASAKPTVTTATKATSTTLTGWTTALAAGDVLEFNVDSITTATRATIYLHVSL